MNILETIQFNYKGKRRFLSFGIPVTKEEFEKMFRLRYRVYISEAGYGGKDSFSEEREVDEYDTKARCIYFISTLDGEIIGTVRLIVGDSLPVQKDYFEFREPTIMKEIPKAKVMEVSRLISRPNKFILPRHFIMLGLFGAILQFCLENNIEAGYAAIERALKEKLEKIKFPFYSIKEFHTQKSILTQKFSGYFEERANELCLIYFFTDEVRRWLERIKRNKLFFKRIDEKNIFLRRGIYLYLIGKFLKIFKRKSSR